jgi:hypothetical protein
MWVPSDIELFDLWAEHYAPAVDSDLGANRAALRLGDDTGGIWNTRNLTFCISTAFTATERTDIRTAMTVAGDAWRAETNTSYTYVPGEDALCNENNGRVTFHIRPMTASELESNYAATAFFPEYERARRRIAIRPSQITSRSGFHGLMIHELGHTLGFVHEQLVRSDTGCADQDEVGRALTRYDAESIMHYTSCNGGRSSTLSVYGVHLAIDRTGTVWMTNLDNAIYRFNATRNAWERQPGSARDIGAGGGQVWRVGENRRFYRWDGCAWQLKSAGSDGAHITVDSSGRPWIVNSDGSIYVENGNGWLRQPGSGLDIGAGRNGSVWITGENKGIYQYQSSSGGVTLPEWIRVTGAARSVAVDDTGTPWVVNGELAVYSNRWE